MGRWKQAEEMVHTCMEAWTNIGMACMGKTESSEWEEVGAELLGGRKLGLFGNYLVSLCLRSSSFALWYPAASVVSSRVSKFRPLIKYKQSNCTFILMTTEFPHA